MAEAAGQQVISVETRVRLYSTMALNFKTITFRGAQFFTRYTVEHIKLFNYILHTIILYNVIIYFLYRYYLHKAQNQVVNYNRLPANLNWLITDHGFRFFIDRNWIFSPYMTMSSFTTLSDSNDPLSYVTRVCI